MQRKVKSAQMHTNNPSEMVKLISKHTVFLHFITMSYAKYAKAEITCAPFSLL